MNLCTIECLLSGKKNYLHLHRAIFINFAFEMTQHNLNCQKVRLCSDMQTRLIILEIIELNATLARDNVMLHCILCYHSRTICPL